ncbi:NTE family protein [Amycolatopsis arida]|uniref:NTE family protein n=1 Tax=Amycolatopsis arida TaxID=587909 RepID=A0A1I5TY97_9PSEU|nr:patatin-like phospholipase family protein [Amycolatopsis arida]TDX95928.1 NTE family protein [Amycolatopsis arida]SFP87597.1 NTE family protein [Amycolatopsis arida]
MERSGVGLCLSGGGYRAMLFHTGVLWRLNELGQLPRLAVISSVSSGAIAAGVLAHAWPDLEFRHGVAVAFQERVVRPVRALAGVNIDARAVLRGLARPWRSVGEEVAASLRRHLFGRRMLAELPESPRFVFTATNLRTGALWRFSGAAMGDPDSGPLPPVVSLATAVAASSAFPPFLSPVVLRHGGRGVVLSDGGVFDNLALDPATECCATVLVSDGGRRIRRLRRVPRDWPRHVLRAVDVVDNQVRSLRKRALLASYDRGDFRGAYWGTYRDIADFGLPDALPAPAERTLALAELPTRLHHVPPTVQERLINWGYAVCDAGMRRWVLPGAASPRDFPYPTAGVG